MIPSPQAPVEIRALFDRLPVDGQWRPAIPCPGPRGWPTVQVRRVYLPGNPFPVAEIRTTPWGWVVRALAAAVAAVRWLWGRLP